MHTLDAEQAYRAMFTFLEKYWERTGRPEELGGLLSYMHLTPGAGTADPALWEDWLVAIQEVKSAPSRP